MNEYQKCNECDKFQSCKWASGLDDLVRDFVNNYIEAHNKAELYVNQFGFFAEFCDYYKEDD